MSELIRDLRRLHGVSTASVVGSGGDAIEMMTSLGKALFDFGCRVVEDIGKAGGPLVQRNNIPGSSSDGISRIVHKKFLFIATELKGIPCPTGTNHLTKLGVAQIWAGDKEQQKLMISLAAKFVNPKVMERSILADIFSNNILQTLLHLQSFSLHLLADHIRLIFHENWVNHVMDSNTVPWFSWEISTGSGGEGGPSLEWVRLFWKSFSGSVQDLSLFSDWPLIPAFLGRPVLCRV